MLKRIIHLFRPIYIPFVNSQLWFAIKYKPFMSDEKYLKHIFRDKFKYELPLNDPLTFTEKMQWLKLYDRKDVYTIMADKVLAKKYVSELIGESHVIPTISVWDDPDDIDFNTLPETFVIKCNHNSGGGMCICRDKESLDCLKTRKLLKKAIRRNDYYIHREWPYKNIEKKVFAEELLTDDNVPINTSEGLIDYKFFCFNGRPKYVCIGFANIVDNIKHDWMSYYDLNFKPAPFGRPDHASMKFDVSKPDNFEEMIRIAEKLSTNTKFVRVDLYNIKGRIYFSEFTFFPGGGMSPFYPSEWEKQLGDYIELYD